ncbi:flagellar protein export ATPase FliI [Treponema phagedenis]|uniref:Flagellum-specific ATP synthase n=1 Tax=Treponema phagedenis TaxID=162 RepID=A0A0B7GTG6_TREPH|nr:flagellar protein export ATPase FliI [Treponema phagedenis]NVP24544.1 flagellar protein export ATPase FliI [Treponema phagedenis]QEJ94759.1 flagellar protein export ATPase FliI [Treponema phagedenis]QEJ97696.1 flagellar protein export ATPase FliI [Treponema phagedenis]QEK00665.1 flagellar protein export ATPase FliI [Treponema phagedenis]QEK03264.1 flagellar protein export ATPase FliI [Treponema phagedenis]
MIDMLEKYEAVIQNTEPIKFTGTVTAVRGMLVESRGPQAVVGELCKIKANNSSDPIMAEVVGLDEGTVKLMSYSDLQGIELGSEVIAEGEILSVPVGDALLGRVINALGKAIDGKQEVYSSKRYPVLQTPPNPMDRKPIRQRIVTGVRAIDSLLAVGCGQRLGIFSGSGVGKSTLMGMIARNTNADVNVIALIGERGREVMDFIEHDLGPEGLKKSVVVTATSDESPLARIRGAYTATAIAEYFRDQGKDVMLLFDSVTRFAKAQREIGLAAGEPAATRGYTPSVFETLPKLLERSGTSSKGSITGFYTVLVDGDDLDEPISDAVRGIIDGHIVLSRKLAQRSHYPAIDILNSISRLAHRVSGRFTNQAVLAMRKSIAIYEESADMIQVGAYQKGSSEEVDKAIALHQPIKEFLMQEVTDPAPLESTIASLSKITGIEIPVEEIHAIGAGAPKKYIPTVPASETAELYAENNPDSKKE